MPRVALVVHGRGRGHASRALACARALRDAGHVLSIHGGGDAEHVLKDTPEFRPLQPVQPGLAAPLGWLRRLARDARELPADTACVVSDGDQPSLVFARRRELPSVAVDHGLALVHGRHAVRPPAMQRLYERLNAAPLGLADRLVAVHFLPFETAEPRLLPARPDVRDDLRGPTARDPFFLAYFRDDNGREPLALARDAGADIVCFGERDPEVPGVTFHRSDRAAFADHLRRCAGVLASAGSNLLAECIYIKKPILALHRRGDAEQALNARLIDHAGLGLGRDFETLSARDCEEFLTRSRHGDFATCDLERALPPVSSVVVGAVADLL